MAMENAPMKNWELTLYEMQRKPQEPITDGTKIAVSPRSLQSELMCPICLDILKVTMTTKECLHRFCSDCIVTALRNGNKECPTCRKKLVSKRSLRRDPNFDALIAKIYPDREEYEAHQNRVLAKLNKQQYNGRASLHESGQSLLHSSNDIDSTRYRNRRSAGNSGFATADSVISEDDAASITGSLNQRASRVNSDAESGTMETTSVGGASSVEFGHPHQQLHSQRARTSSNNATSTSATTVIPEVELMLRPLPPEHRRGIALTSSVASIDGTCVESHGNQVKSEDGEHRTAASSPHFTASEMESEESLLAPAVKYIKVPSNATVDHLGRFLSIRFNLQRVHKDVMENDPYFSLFYYNEASGEYVHLQPSMTIDEISRSYWSGVNSLSLYYLREQSHRHS
ncbi:unnamed protein product [Taenia asiatica]|uniref:RING-type E3 ubiquitin transferase n=1 Tax=Taenia asiatica TaxID=60517 RepID=A0A0R3WCT3_TAEAS|nr:unnamed protein product [Taenia asiatica]